MSDDDKAATITSISMLYKDHHPRPGDRIKQYVVDGWREREWEEETAPRFNVDPHVTTGCELHDDPECEYCKLLTRQCPRDGRTSLLALRDAECETCNALYALALATPSAQAWLAEKAKRPPICADRMKLSDEIAPEWPSMGDHPLLAVLPRGDKP